jgi:predicted ATPase/DNA-binding CsgD family transcriptional regulator
MRYQPAPAPRPALGLWPTGRAAPAEPAQRIWPYIYVMARPAQRPGNLPAETTTFVGRRRELADVRKKLSEARLVSLVGPGGVGKTRLAIRAAAEVRRAFRGGGWLVELAEVLDPALVSHAVMAALDLRDQAATEPLALLLSYLRDKELLLVVDNCEHLLEAAAQVVTDMMKAAPGLRVIATSREPLSVPGEHLVPVPPLELPAPDAAEPLASVQRGEAVMLFTERAAAASGTFELTAGNQAAVVDLCRRLDGLPLAIELAAVRTRVLSVEQIRDRLTDRFSLLTGGSRAALPRHQTLRTTIEWSHDLLSDGERAVLRRSCVFAGRFTLADAEPVCASPGVPPTGVLDLIASLVDKSLVMKEDFGGLACYRLHETMREFAGLKLAEAGEQEPVVRRCKEYYQSSFGLAVLESRFRLPTWLDWAELEIDNVRAVLRRCLADGDAACGIELATALGWYWITRATTEGIRWLGGFLELPDGVTEARGWAYFLRGFLSVLKADPAGARPALRAAVTVGRDTGQHDLLSEALSIASIAENLAGDHPAARRLLDEAHVAAVTVGAAYPPGALAVQQARVLNGFFEADLATVRSAATEGARLARGMGDHYGLEMMLLNLGSEAMLSGDLDRGVSLLGESLRMAHQVDDRVAQFYLLDAMGTHAALRGQARLAARLFGASYLVRTEAGANEMPFFAPLLARGREAARAALGAKFEAEFQAGKLLDRDAALELALGKPAGDAEAPHDAGTVARKTAAARNAAAAGGNPAAGVLAKREADVARLVAEGLTNKQIGARLFISERTVDSHVRSIMNKLGVNSRAQVAAWMASADHR